MDPFLSGISNIIDIPLPRSSCADAHAKGLLLARAGEAVCQQPAGVK